MQQKNQLSHDMGRWKRLRVSTDFCSPRTNKGMKSALDTCGRGIPAVIEAFCTYHRLHISQAVCAGHPVGECCIASTRCAQTAAHSHQVSCHLHPRLDCQWWRGVLKAGLQAFPHQQWSVCQVQERYKQLAGGEVDKQDSNLFQSIAQCREIVHIPHGLFLHVSSPHVSTVANKSILHKTQQSNTRTRHHTPWSKDSQCVINLKIVKGVWQLATQEAAWSICP